MAEQWRILVVETEDKLNWNIVNTLQKDGYLVRGVTSGAEAIRLLWSEAYDVVICCQPLLDADGFELLQWMRTYCPNAQMIMLAQAGSGVMRPTALEMGVASYLEKPLDMHTLKDELRRLLHQTGFSANLDSFDLLDVIQIITMSRKSIALVVSTGLEEQGVLRFQNGELIWAEYGTLRGEEAFFALAAHKNGTVIHRHWNEQITPNVTLPLSRLIFQALQYRSKYAAYQQLSSELDAVRPANGGNNGHATLPPMPSTSMPVVLPDFPKLPPTTMPAALHDLEDDDRPFLFVAEDLPSEQSSSHIAIDRFLQENGQEMDPGTAVRSPDADNIEWWETNNTFSGVQRSGNLHPITGDGPGKPASVGDGAGKTFSNAGGIEDISPSVVHKVSTRHNGSLPSWLTDQPTDLDLPVMRGNTGLMPVAPQPVSPPTPVPPSIIQLSPTDPTLPALSPDENAEWSPAPQPGALHPGESGLRKLRSEEAFYTGPQRVIRSGTSSGRNSGSLMRPSPAEWQGPASRPGLTGGNGSKEEGPEKTVESLQSLHVLKKTGTLPSLVPPVQSEDRPEVPLPPVAAEISAPRGQVGIVLPPQVENGGLQNLAGTPQSPRIEEVSPRNQTRALPVTPFEEIDSRAQAERAFFPQFAAPPDQQDQLDLADILPFDDLILSNQIEVAPVKSAEEKEKYSQVELAKVKESDVANKAGQAEKSGRRNFPALAAALQTLGYSVPGFIASAVIGLDGTPIAQVAVDDLDISSKCHFLSNIVQSALQALAQEYEHTVVTSTTQHILLRQISDQKDVFQILITARETSPAESLEVMANVEAAIASALH